MSSELITFIAHKIFNRKFRPTGRFFFSAHDLTVNDLIRKFFDLLSNIFFNVVQDVTREIFEIFNVHSLLEVFLLNEFTTVVLNCFIRYYRKMHPVADYRYDGFVSPELRRKIQKEGSTMIIFLIFKVAGCIKGVKQTLFRKIIQLIQTI